MLFGKNPGFDLTWRNKCKRLRWGKGLFHMLVSYYSQPGSKHFVFFSLKDFSCQRTRISISWLSEKDEKSRGFVSFKQKKLPTLSEPF